MLSRFSPERLTEQRVKKELSQEALGQMIGEAQYSISRYENGFREPSATVIARLADALECTTDYLLGRN